MVDVFGSHHYLLGNGWNTFFCVYFAVGSNHLILLVNNQAKTLWTLLIRFWKSLRQWYFNSSFIFLIIFWNWDIHWSLWHLWYFKYWMISWISLMFIKIMHYEINIFVCFSIILFWTSTWFFPNGHFIQVWNYIVIFLTINDQLLSFLLLLTSFFNCLLYVTIVISRIKTW